jgi:hypothetical protein
LDFAISLARDMLNSGADVIRHELRKTTTTTMIKIKMRIDFSWQLYTNSNAI